MNIKEQFNLIAKEYDQGRKKFIPCFEDYYIKTTDFLAANIKAPEKVLDLGAGTGLLTMFWYQHFPDAEYVLVDIAEDMIDVSKQRFQGIDNVSFQVLDYTEEFLFTGFDVIMSALSIHHLEQLKKQELFRKIYDNLSEGKMFVNYDQFCAGSEELDIWFDSYWENGLHSSGLSDRDIELWKERRKLDRECSVEEEISMLECAGFQTVKCIYSYQKFAVIIAIK